jgi:hypothetical protein
MEDETLQHFTDFLIAADTFISFNRKLPPNLLDATPLSALPFGLKFEEPFVEGVRVRPLELYHLRPLGEEQHPCEIVETRERENEEGSAIVFDDGTGLHVRKLYCAASKVVDEVVLQRGQKFTSKRARSLGEEALGLFDQVCQK